MESVDLPWQKRTGSSLGIAPRPTAHRCGVRCGESRSDGAVGGEHGRTAKIAQAVGRFVLTSVSLFSAYRLARSVHMSVASLNRYFRSVTAMSPLQYQKQVRRQETRILLLTEQQDAATTAFKAGYASLSHYMRQQ